MLATHQSLIRVERQRQDMGIRILAGLLVGSYCRLASECVHMKRSTTDRGIGWDEQRLRCGQAAYKMPREAIILWDTQTP